MTRMRHVRDRVRPHDVLRRLAGATTAVVLALGGIVVTGTASASDEPEPTAAPDTIWSLDFEDGTWDPWQQRGDSTLKVVDNPDGDGNVLSITRDESWKGIESPLEPSVLDPAKTYNFTMRARLESGKPNTGTVRFVGMFTAADVAGGPTKYEWIGDSPITSEEWTTIAGTWVPGTWTDEHVGAVKDSAPTGVQVYVETALNTSGTYTVLVDDILVTERGEPRLTDAYNERRFVPGEKVKISGIDFPGNVSVSFEQGGQAVGFSAQTVQINGVGGFTDKEIVLPVSVDPALDLYLVATSEGTSPIRTQILLANSSLDADPASVDKGGKAQLRGAGFVAGELVEIAAQGATTVNVRAQSDGTFEATWTAPPLPVGELLITATSVVNGKISATTTVDVVGPEVAAPEIVVVDDGDVVPSDVVTISGAGFSPNQSGTITMTASGYFDPVGFDTDATGKFLKDVTIPNYWTPGNVTVHATQSRSGDRAETVFEIATSSLSLTNAVAAGTVTIIGEGFIANEQVQYKVTIGAQTQSFSIRSDAEGCFTATAPVPYDATGVSASAEQWGRIADAMPISVAASVAPLLLPATTDVNRGEGKSVKVTAVRFPNGAVKITAAQGDNVVSTVSAEVNEGGTFTDTVSVPIPMGTPLGPLTIEARRTDGTEIATTTVNVVPEKVDRAAIITESGSVTSGVSFLLTGSAFTPNEPVTVQFFDGNFGVDEVTDKWPIGGATMTTNTVGSFNDLIAIPHVGSGQRTVTIYASQGDDHRAVKTVTVTPASGDADTAKITVNGAGNTYAPGDELLVEWVGLVPGHILASMKFDSELVGSDVLVLSADPPAANAPNGEGYLSLNIDTLRGKGKHTVIVSAVQGAAAGHAEIKVENDFSGYEEELRKATELIALRDNGSFRGIDAPWGDLVSAANSNQFIAAGGEHEATQGNANRAMATLEAARKAVAQALLEATISSADTALASYARAFDTNAALAGAVAGSAQALVEKLITQGGDSLSQANATRKVTSPVAEYDFSIPREQQPGIPSNVWTKFSISNDVLTIDRINDWEGLEFPVDQFQPNDRCTFEADVSIPEDAYVIYKTEANPDESTFENVVAPQIHFQAKHTGSDKFEWIGYANPRPGVWQHITETWDVPDGGVDHIRLVATHSGIPNFSGGNDPEGLRSGGEDRTKEDPWFTFYVDNVSVSCTRQVAASDQTDADTLLSLETQLQDAIQRLTYALVHFEAGQVLWAPAPGNEPGWVEGDGLFTDDSIARWIGHNLYIRGNSSELEGRTVVAHDLNLNKDARYSGGWNGFNFGTVSIGSQIALSGKVPALLVCDDLVVDPGSFANVNGGALAVADQKSSERINGWTESAAEYCQAYSTMAEGVSNLSQSLASRPTDGGTCDGGCGPVDQGDKSTAKVKDGVLTLTAGTPNADGLYVFQIDGAELARATSIVLVGLHADQLDQASGGRIDSMKPAVINVTGSGPVNWKVESISLRDKGSNSYEQLYVGDKFWHPDLGKVAGALMWNFPEVEDTRAENIPTADVGAAQVDYLAADPTNPTRLPDDITPGVTIWTTGLGVNFLGSILIPHASLFTQSVSLNGRLYVGGDYVMHDTLTKRDGDPLYGGGYYPNGSADLLGHSEGHNYPWWFDPFTSAPVGAMTIKKDVDENVMTELEKANNGIGDTTDLFAQGRLRCMHVEDAAERHLTPQSDAWWSDDLADEPYLLTVDVAWWLKVGDTISLPNLPQGTLCGLNEDRGLFTTSGATASGMDGLRPSGTGEAPTCDCEDRGFTTPQFEPVIVPAGWAWALPDVEFDGASSSVAVSTQGPTASLLLTTETKSPAATITNALTPVGRAKVAKVAKVVDSQGQINELPAGSGGFEFTWSTSSDGYVYLPDNDGDLPDDDDSSAVSRLAPGTSTGTVVVASGQEATPRYCPTANEVPSWWSKDKNAVAWWADADTPECLDLWFPVGAEITWTETLQQYEIDETWYDIREVDYQGNKKVAISQGDVAVTTTVVNTLVKAPASFAVQKVITGSGQTLVPPDTEFTVVYEAWEDLNHDGLIDADTDKLINQCPDTEEMCSGNTLVVRADGTRVYRTNYETGTLIRLVSEATPPVVPGVTWGESELNTDVVIMQDGAKAQTITVTNTAHGPASFHLSKALPAENIGTHQLDFGIAYTVYRDGYPATGGDREWVATDRKTHTFRFGSDITSGPVTAVSNHTLQIGDIVVISEDTFDGGYNNQFEWDQNGYRVQITGLDPDGKRVGLTSCQARGLENGCSPREFRITTDNVNTLVVTVVNRLVGPPVMPMTGGALAAWLAIVAGFGLGGYLSFRRGTTVRHATTRGGAMR